VRNRPLMRAFGGNRVNLQGEDLERFFVYAYKITRHTRTLITFCVPVLFLVGGLHDALTMDTLSSTSLLQRGVLVVAMLACAGLMQVHIAMRWRELAGIGWCLLFSSAIMLTTLHEPARLSLIHVVITLVSILLLPHALRPLATVGVLLALLLPLMGILHALHAPPTLWLSYLAFVLVGAVIGLIQRRAQLDSALDTFLLRKNLLARLHADSLTGIFNREGWDVHAQQTIKRCVANAHGYAVVFFDLDHFKQINDREGHAMGDTILRCVARIMRENSQPEHVLARIGGEEFVVLLPAADETAAWHHAERIRKAIERCNQHQVKTTISAGVAGALPEDALDATLTRADAAMLEAKRRGRNQVLCASETNLDAIIPQQARLQLT